MLCQSRHSSIFNVQCYFCQFANFCPSVAEIWTLKEMAIRMAIAIGLHKEPSHSLSHFSHNHLELRRKIFWTVSFSVVSVTYIKQALTAPYSYTLWIDQSQSPQSAQSVLTTNQSI